MMNRTSFAGLGVCDAEQAELLKAFDGAVHHQHWKLEFEAGGFDGGFAPEKGCDPVCLFGIGQQTCGWFSANGLPGAFVGIAAFVYRLH